MTCCGARLAPGRTHCAYCRRTMALIRERRCVACRGTIHDGDSQRVEGLCSPCRIRWAYRGGPPLRLSAATRRLLQIASRHRCSGRMDTSIGAGVGRNPPPGPDALPRVAP